MSIDCSKNKLTTIPKELFALAKLDRLHLSENTIKQLPQDIPENTSLKVIDLSSNGLTQVHPSLWKCTGLSKLHLDNNALTTLPAGISALQKLTILDIGNNPLESLPIKELSNLPMLQQVVFMNKKEIDENRNKKLNPPQPQNTPTDLKK
jgi:Leucine-rich repeat (LRR) protein